MEYRPYHAPLPPIGDERWAFSFPPSPPRWEEKYVKD